VYFALGPIDPAQTAAGNRNPLLAPLNGLPIDEALLGASSDRPIGIVELRWLRCIRTLWS
jgi:hypothetical protein